VDERAGDDRHLRARHLGYARRAVAARREQHPRVHRGDEADAGQHESHEHEGSAPAIHVGELIPSKTGFRAVMVA